MALVGLAVTGVGRLFLFIIMGFDHALNRFFQRVGIFIAHRYHLTFSGVAPLLLLSGSGSAVGRDTIVVSAWDTLCGSPFLLAPDQAGLLPVRSIGCIEVGVQAVLLPALLRLHPQTQEPVHTSPSCIP